MLEEIFKGISIIDIETTTLDGETGEIIEAALATYKGDDWEVGSKLYGSENPIDPGSSAMTHISNRMIDSLPLFGAEVGEDLRIVGFDWSLYKVAHNAQYDRAFIAKKLQQQDYDTKDFEDYRTWICTLELAKKLLEGKVERFSLNYLRYALDLDVPDDYMAHRAGNDVYITGKLLEYLVMMMIEDGLLDLEKPVAKQLQEYSTKIIPYETWPFGKHKGQKFSEVPEDYYKWALENMDALQDGNPKYDARLVKAIEKHFS